MSLPLDDSFEKFLNSDKVINVVNLLTKHKVKLWEMKNFSQQDSQSEVEELINKLSDESGIMEDELRQILVKLQEHSVRKINENKRFNEDGLAVFKIKIIGNNQQQGKTICRSFEASINLTGNELKNYIMSYFDLKCDNLKIICNGKIVKEDSLLLSQDIKNHSTLLVMCIYQKISHDPASAVSDETRLATDIKDAVSLLTDLKSKGYDIGFDQFKLQDQNGISLDISPENSQCITSAMILHEKAKSLMKQKDYLKALILLAEADNEFKNCTDRILLERTDNYALLNLDIVWCHLCLENLNDLKNAEERLNSCERSLKKCYGADLERLSKIKSETVNKHTPIFVRLNVLNAILNYHKGKKKECREFLNIATRELKKISIDEEKLIQVMSMGFNSTEARLALRASFNNVDEAIEQIIKKKAQKKEAMELEKQQERAKKLERKYGLTLNGNKPIDAKLLDDLVQFGYSESRAARALIKANNNFQLALDLIQLEQDDAPSTSSGDLDSIDNLSLAQLMSLGFESDVCKKAIEAFKSNLDKAAEFLIENKSEQMQALLDRLEEMIESVKPSTSTAETLAKSLNAQNLLKNISKDIPEDDEAYLDFNIDEDSYYINKYFSLLDQY